MFRLRVSERRRRQLVRGHLWVYDSDIASADGVPEPGEPCRIEDERGGFLAVGYVNPRSTIAARVLSFRDEEPGFPLIARRLDEVEPLRDRIAALRGTDAVRLVNGEGDRLPGLIVDRFGPLVTVQPTTAGMARHAEALAARYLERGAKTVVVRGDSSGLAREEFPLASFVRGAAPPSPARFREGAVEALFEPVAGHKTGAYLDIRPARLTLAPLSAGGRMLDAFCNSGLFGLHALAAGAERVVFVESGKGPLELLAGNVAALPEAARRRAEVRPGDAFARLEEAARAGERYDAVVVDPPPFVAKRRDLERGLAAYREIFRRGLNLLAPSGIMLAATCSAPVGMAELVDCLVDAGGRAGVRFDVVFSGTQDLDHPSAPAMPETGYLKFVGVRRAGG